MSIYKNTDGVHAQCTIIKFLDGGLATIKIGSEERTVCISTLTLL